MAIFTLLCPMFSTEMHVHSYSLNLTETKAILNTHTQKPPKTENNLNSPSIHLTSYLTAIYIFENKTFSPVVLRTTHCISFVLLPKRYTHATGTVISCDSVKPHLWEAKAGLITLLLRFLVNFIFSLLYPLLLFLVKDFTCTKEAVDSNVPMTLAFSIFYSSAWQQIRKWTRMSTVFPQSSVQWQLSISHLSPWLPCHLTE